MSDRLSNTSIDREQAVLFSGLTVGFVLCILLAWLPLTITISHFVFEDSFYYLCVARNIVEGNGSSFDGIHPTNGFQPLWMLVSILLVFPFSPGSPIPVHLLLSMCAVFHALTAFLIYRTVLLGGHRTVAVIAALVWLFNYSVAGIAMCGLETALFAFFVIATVYFYLLRRRDLSAGQSAAVGVMLGLTALTRFDGALLGFAMAADQLCLALLRRERPTQILARLAPMSLVGSAMMVPWMAWSWSISGTILPNSHRAVSFWYSPEDHLKGGLLKGMAKILVSYAPVMAKIYGFRPLFSFTTLLFAIFCGVLLWGREKRAGGFPVIVFVIYPIVHILYYVRYFVPYNRYLYPAHVLIFTGIMTAVGGWLPANRGRRFAGPLGMALGAVVAANLLLSGVKAWREGRASVEHSVHWIMFNEAMPWIKENVRPHEKVGAFNCGIYGYFSGRTVVNLDGVINDSVIPALEGGWLIQYLYEERITYVVDWEMTVDNTFKTLGGVPDYRSKFAVVKRLEQPWGPVRGARLIILRLLN